MVHMQDVANAVGGDKNKVRILSLNSHSVAQSSTGVGVVTMALDEGVCDEYRSPLHVAQDLKLQAEDPHSCLQEGKSASYFFLVLCAIPT